MTYACRGCGGRFEDFDVEGREIDGADYTISVLKPPYVRYRGDVQSPPVPYNTVWLRVSTGEISFDMLCGRCIEDRLLFMAVGG